jgi:hypothetical protein
MPLVFHFLLLASEQWAVVLPHDLEPASAVSMLQQRRGGCGGQDQDPV